MTEGTDYTLIPVATEAPEATAEPEEPKTDEASEKMTLLIQVRETDPAPGYILVQTDQSAGFLPLPTEGEKFQAIVRTLEDGTEWRNVIRMTPEGFCMIESDCEGHDCIEEGKVTLENMRDRLLWNMVICAPYRLTLSLYSPADAAEISRRWLGY